MINFNSYAYPDPQNQNEHRSRWAYRERPVIVCLCGSTRFMQAFYDANMNETLQGKIVLTVGMSSKGDCKPTDEQKIALDVLHKRKIDLADEILVLNVGGYVGESTRSEIAYAFVRDKLIRWLEPDKAGMVMIELGLAAVANNK